ncbi:MAG TPA: PA14 domain-containing protein [Chloroflexota bacterium]|nr:PA14 domain-containing protein [Chloroflexota bacterium]
MIGRVHAGQALGAVLVAGIVVLSGWVDVDRYFNKQMHDASVFAEYSATATFIGREAASLPLGTRVIVDERQLNEPTIKFLAPNMPKPEGYRQTTLPLSEDRDTVLFLSGDQSADADYAQRLYPGASVQRFSPPHGGPVLMNEVRVSAAQIQALHGLNVAYQPGGAIVKAPTLDGPLPQAPPGATEATISGAIHAPSYGDYGFSLDAPSAELKIDGQRVAHEGEPVRLTLARGMHRLELTVHASDAASPVKLLWRPPAAAGLAPVPEQSLFSGPVADHGLLGRFYPNASWNGTESLQEIDPFIAVYYQVTPLPLPFSAEWTGKLAAPVSGVYRFSVSSIDSSQLFLDGQTVANDAPLTLSAGLHDLRLRYEAHSGHNRVELRWQPPGRDYQVVAPDFLFPDAGAAAAQPLPDLPAAANPSAARPQGPVRSLEPLWSADLGVDSMPAAVALDHDGSIYVADSARHTVVKVSPDGKVLWTATPPPRTAGLQQLASAAVAPDDSVLALDGETGTISRFSADGRYLGVLAKDLPVYHPRGLTVASGGDLFLADTGGSHILHLSPDGHPVGQIGIRGKDRGALDQPSGIAVASDGSVIVVDPSAQKMVRFAGTGAALAEWPFAEGLTVNGPQLALSPDQTLWATDTNGGVVLAYYLSGELQGSYTTPGGMTSPSGVAAGNGYLVVAEPDARRIRKLVLPS